VNCVVVFATQYLIYLLPISPTCSTSYSMIQPAVDKDYRIGLKMCANNGADNKR